MAHWIDKEMATIYRSHASILQYLLTNGKDLEVSLRQVIEHWHGCAELIEREAENNDS